MAGANHTGGKETGGEMGEGISLSSRGQEGSGWKLDSRNFSKRCRKG